VFNNPHGLLIKDDFEVSFFYRDKRTPHRKSKEAYHHCIYKRAPCHYHALPSRRELKALNRLSW
jgi:hypothetical protein